MKFKFLGAILLAIFAIAGTSCKSGKSCSGGGWYGNRNLGYEATPTDQQTIYKMNSEYIVNEETCISANP